jgi:hypothetical protein
MRVLLLLATVWAWQATAGTIPDESALPQWTSTFANILALRARNFQTPPARNPSQDVTDDELLRGKDAESPAANLTLQGADECRVATSTIDGTRFFVCTFNLAGRSTEEVAQDYVRLVRMVEKATNTHVLRNVTPIAIVTATGEQRHATLENGIGVHENLSGSFRQVSIDVSPPSKVATVPGNPTDVAGSVARIEQSAHLNLPPLSPGPGIGPITIRNDTVSTLTVYLTGPTFQRQVILPRSSVTVTMNPGVYKLAGELDDKSVLPFFGVRNYSGGETERFYLAPR